MSIFPPLDIPAEARAFCAEMQKGLAGVPDSLAMIPTYIPIGDRLSRGAPVIVLDAGGTHFRAALWSMDNQDERCKTPLSHFSDHPMPGTQGTITAEQFFGQVVDIIAPLLPYSDKIGFCFSYPTEILPNKDGRILRMTKEVRIENIAGKIIGEELGKVFAARGLPPKSVSVLNDTTAALLGGMSSADPAQSFDSYIGFILGTGTNTCYVEKQSNIAALNAEMLHVSKDEDHPLLSVPEMAVNLESGNYNKLPTLSADDTLDAASIDPTRQKLEKMTSGAYFGEVLRLLLVEQRDRFSPAVRISIDNTTEILMQDISAFSLAPATSWFLGGTPTENDRCVLFELVVFLYDRAARITAIQIAGILLQNRRGKNPIHPVAVVAEGTFFSKSLMFRRRLETLLQSTLADEMGLYVRLIQAENLTLTGAAVAALSGGSV